MTHSTTAGKKLKKWAASLGVFALWIGLWQIAAAALSQEILLVSPGRAALRLFQLVQEPEFWLTVGTSCLRIMSGFLLALAVGAVLAVAMSRSRFLYAFFHPALSVIKATPVASFIILALVWVTGRRLSIFISFLMVLPMVWSNLDQGIRNTDKKLLEMGELFRFSPWEKARYLYIPSVMPYFVSACTTGIGFAWKAGIAAEVLGVPKHSMGTRIYEAKIYLETPDLFAWTAVIIFMSIVIEKGFLKLLKAANRRLQAREQEASP
ncbi:MAG: ABC transporter permease subunit [Oscillospiraceae bacterium]|nr:ABC transporter permease subunit [Oscillospiraceae bacterium]